MAASSAAERSATTPELRHLRAQQVILVFSNQVRGTVDTPTHSSCVITLLSLTKTVPSEIFRNGRVELSEC